MSTAMSAQPMLSVGKRVVTPYSLTMFQVYLIMLEIQKEEDRIGVIQ